MKKVTTLFATLAIVLFGASTMYAQTVVSISAAKDSTDGTIVTVKGIATTPSLESDSRTSFFIQQDGVGINIFDFGTPAKVIAAGDSVQVTGELDTFNGLREIVVDDVTTDITVINSGNAVPEPKMISYQEFIDAGDPSTDTLKLQGTLIRVNGLTADVADWPTDPGSGSTNLTATNSVDSTYNIRVLAQTTAMGTVPSEKFDIIGVIGTFNGSQISPRFDTDIISYYDITFQVNMNAAIDSAVFLPEEHDVFVAGDFNGFSNNADTLKDGDNDGIYSGTVNMAPGTYGFKYYTNTPRVEGWESGDNRSLVVTKDSTLAADSINIATPDLTQAVFGDVQLFFQVNMEVQIVAGNFDPTNEEHSITVAGSMNDWSATANELTQSQDENIYETTITLEEVAIPSSFQWKFVLNGSGWEGGDNKVIEVTEAGFDSESGTYVAINNTGTPPFFDGVTLDDIFTGPSTVIFEVDMRPAYYFAEDSTRLPLDIQTSTSTGTDVDSVFTNGPLTNTLNGWETWGDANLGLRTDLRMYDDGATEGDLVAGDSIFTITIDYEAGDAKTGEYKFSANGFDNENSFGGNHRLVVEAGGRYRQVFGAMLQDDGTYDDTVYDEYILVTAEGAIPVRNGGTGDDEVEVSNEEDVLNTPDGYALNQNYPNPFNPSTTISFNLPNAADVNLTVYNILGQRVATLLNKTAFTSGNHTINFDASNLASGIYIYRLEAGTFTSQKRMTLIK